LIAPGTKSWKDLESGIKVGTASLRREAQLRHLRSDLNIVPIRGNVGTRLKKLRSGEVGALILALAGLKRLQCDNLASYIFPIDEMLPAIAQGALGVECREGDNKIKSLLSLINCERSKLCVEAERIFLSTLDGSCRSPIAGLAEIKQKKIVFTGLVAKQDGSMLIRRQAKGDLTQTNELGIKLGHELKSLFNP
jgi:hydroxymethylbilane synthase